MKSPQLYAEILMDSTVFVIVTNLTYKEDIFHHYNNSNLYRTTMKTESICSTIYHSDSKCLMECFIDPMLSNRHPIIIRLLYLDFQ